MTEPTTPSPAKKDDGKHKRRRYQFTVRSLLVLVLLVSLVMAWARSKVVRARRHYEAVVALEELGADLFWECPGRPGESETTRQGSVLRLGVKPPHPTWAGVLFGKDRNNRLVSALLIGCRLSEADLRHLSDLNDLEYLNLDHTEIDDSALEHLRKLGNLETLSVRHTRITKKGIQRLKARLDDTQIHH